MIPIPRLGIAWLVSLALVAGWGAWNRHKSDAAHAAQMEAAKQAAKAEAYTLRQSLRETERRMRSMEEVSRDASRKLSAARRDAAAASSAADSLRERVDDLVGEVERGTYSCAAAGSDAAASAARMLADLQRRADERAGILASYADAASISGQACERAYLSLTKATDQP